MSATLTVPAPAKLNLFLHVTGRRPDGYHNLESLMVLLDFGDRLTLAYRDDGAIVLTDPLPGVAIEADMTARAAHLLKRVSGSKAGVTITLDKRIPLGAGMGGGSSDAATVLLGLNRLWELRLARDTLMQLGLELGADVPFFVHGSNAFASGIGEQLQAVSVPRMSFLIAMPPVATPTGVIFAATELARDTPSVALLALPLDFGRNDLQPVAAQRARAIGTALRALDALDFTAAGRTPIGTARMTGSGSAVFRMVDAAFPASAEAWRATADREKAAWKLLETAHYRSPKLHDANGRLESGTRLFHARVIPFHPLRDFAAK